MKSQKEETPEPDEFDPVVKLQPVKEFKFKLVPMETPEKPCFDALILELQYSATDSAGHEVEVVNAHEAKDLLERIWNEYYLPVKEENERLTKENEYYIRSCNIAREECDRSWAKIQQLNEAINQVVSKSEKWSYPEDVGNDILDILPTLKSLQTTDTNQQKDE